MRPAGRFLVPLLLAATLGSACVGEGEQLIKPEPPRPEAEEMAVHFGAPVDLGSFDRLTLGEPQAPTALTAAHGRVVVGTAGDLRISHPDLPDGLLAMPLRRTDGEPEATGKVTALARRGSGGVLAAAQAGLFHDHQGSLYLSPLTHALPGPVVKLDALGEGSDEVLWLLPADGAAGQACVVNAEGLHDVRLAVTGIPDAVAALDATRGLIAVGGTLYQVDVAARTAAVVAEGLGRVHAVDRGVSGQLYLGTDHGLLERDAEGVWSRRTLAPEGTAAVPVHAVFAGAGSPILLATPEAVLQLGGAGLARLSTRGGEVAGVARDVSGDTWTVDQGRVVRLLTGAPVTFAQHVKPFVTAHCAGCHRDGQGAPVIDFEDFDVAVEKAARIVTRLEGDGVSPMPPQSVEILTREQYAVVLRWVAGGMKP
jgi:mono/diheme cytochrome c family protein